MGGPQSERTQNGRFLQQSVETRLRVVQEEISLAFTLCNTVELEIRYGHLDRAKYLLHKLHVAVDEITAHVNDPAHVPDKRVRQEFNKQMIQLRLRLSTLGLSDRAQSPAP